MVSPTGGVTTFGSVSNDGSLNTLGVKPGQPLVGGATTANDGGYWLVDSTGNIYTFGNAAYLGGPSQLNPSLPPGGSNAVNLKKPIVAMSPTPDSKGYYEVASDGGVFTFGDAQFFGSMGGQPLDKPIVGISTTPDSKGYYEVASDGGVFTFGDAQFFGSMGGKPLNQPITGIAATSDGSGYYEVASDGGVFTFGSAKFFGSAAGSATSVVVSINPTSDGNGYTEVTSNGKAFPFGDATAGLTGTTS